MFKKNEPKIEAGDIAPNDTPTNCLKNVKYKLKNKLDLSEANLSRLGAEKIIEEKMEKLDFMQWSMLSGNRNNVILLSRYFDLGDYSEYFNGSISLTNQNNLRDLFTSNPNQKNSK